MRFRLILLSALTLALALTSCNKDDARGGIKNVTFRKADITGAKMLALAKGGTPTKAEGDMSTSNILFKVSDDGTLVEVEFTIDVEGENGEIAEQLKTNMRLSPRNVLAIGNKWLWLCGCDYDYPGWQEMEHGQLRNAISFIINSRHNMQFLVRRSDGALFEWTRASGFGFEDDGIDAERIAGKVEPFGDGILALQGGDWGSVLYIKDKGNTLDVLKVTPDNMGSEFVVGLNNGYIASGYANTRLLDPEIKLTTTNGITLPEGTLIEPNQYFFYVHGDAYVVLYNKNSQEMEYWSVDGRAVSGLLETYAKEKVAGIPYQAPQSGDPKEGYTSMSDDDLAWETGHYFPSQSGIFRGTTASWIMDHSRFCFDPGAKTITSDPLPAGYPESGYIDGIAYELDFVQDKFELQPVPQWFKRYDLSKTAPETVNLTWTSDALLIRKTLNFADYWKFDKNGLMWIQTGNLTDGRNITFYIDAVNGTTRYAIEGEGYTGQVISTLIRLN